MTQLIVVTVADQHRHVAIRYGGNHQDARKHESEASQDALFNGPFLKCQHPREKKREAGEYALAPRRGGKDALDVCVDDLLGFRFVHAHRKSTRMNEAGLLRVSVP